MAKFVKIYDGEGLCLGLDNLNGSGGGGSGSGITMKFMFVYSDNTTLQVQTIDNVRGNTSYSFSTPITGEPTGVRVTLSKCGLIRVTHVKQGAYYFDETFVTEICVDGHYVWEFNDSSSSISTGSKTFTITFADVAE